MCASYNCELIHLLYNVLFESIITTTKETPPLMVVCWNMLGRSENTWRI